MKLTGLTYHQLLVLDCIADLHRVPFDSTASTATIGYDDAANLRDDIDAYKVCLLRQGARGLAQACSSLIRKLNRQLEGE